MQGENESVTQYSARAKVLLNHIHHNPKMCDIPGRVASEQDTWRSMEDVFQTIDHVARSEEWNRAFFKPNFETSQPVIQVNEVNYGKATRHNMFDWSNNGQPHRAQFSNNFRDTNSHPRGSLKKGLAQLHYKHSP